MHERESPAHEPGLGLFTNKCDFARFELHDGGHVVGEDADVAVCGGQIDLRDGFFGHERQVRHREVHGERCGFGGVAA